MEFTPSHGLASGLVETPMGVMPTPFGLDFSEAATPAPTPAPAHSPRHFITEAADRSPSLAYEVHSGSADKEFSDRLEQMEITGKATTVEGECEIMRRFVVPLQKQATSLGEQPSDVFSAMERVAASKLKEDVREEAHTWELVFFLLRDSLKTYNGQYASETISNRIQAVPQHRWWAASHKQLLALRLCWDFNFRRALLVLIWLERVYASTSSADKKREQYIPSGYRVNTARLIQSGQGGMLCPTTKRKLVSSLNFDAPRSECAHLHPADEEAERTLYQVVLQHLRCGHVDAARRLCEEKGYTQCAALLQESCETLQHIPGAHTPFPPLEVQLPQEITERFGLKDDGHMQLNTTRYSFSAALCDLSEDDTAPGGINQKAVFSALVGIPSTMLMGLSNSTSFRDVLWASLRGYNEHMTHDILHPFLAGHEDYIAEDAANVLHKTMPTSSVLAELANNALAGCTDPFSQLQSLLIQLFGDKSCTSIESFKQLFAFLHETTSTHAPRLSAHLAMQMWRCRHYVLGDILDEQDHDTLAQHLDSIITAYARHLCANNISQPDLLLSIVPFLASKMEVNRVQLVSEFCVILTANRSEATCDALCEKLVNRLQEVGVSGPEVMTGAQKLLAAGPWKVVEEWGVPIVPKETTRMSDMIESIRLLTFIPLQSVEALTSFNYNCRLLVSSMMMKTESLRAAVGRGVETMEEIDKLQGDVTRCLDGLQSMFGRVYEHIQAQFELQKIRECPSTPSFARLVTERMEAKHWEVYTKSATALAQWQGEVQRKPVVTEAAKVVANELSRANATALLQQSKMQKEKQAYKEWLLREKKARTVFKESALQMVTKVRDSFWLVDLRCVLDELEPVDRVQANDWLMERESCLSELRKKVIPHIAECTLEMFAIHGDHLSTQDRLEECQDCVDIVDALVGDDVADTQSLMECFTDSTQAARIVAYCGRIDCFETDCQRAMKAYPDLAEPELTALLVCEM